LVLDETMVKGIVWFDNGWGYAARVVDAIVRMASFARQGASS
jgi:glyceraldehyde-3-phosphate dehydrogenase/erythrose-4-phosphate dehydrogenase